MARIVILFVSAMLLSSLFFSCENTESNDKTPPTIEGFKTKDTLYIGQDTVNYFSVKVSDNEELSTCKIYIYPGPDMPLEPQTTDGKDSVALIKFVKTYAVSGNTMTIENKAGNFIIPETYYYTSKDSKVSAKTYPVMTGNYRLRFACVDIAGNYDSTDVNVVLLYPPVQNLSEE